MCAHEPRPFAGCNFLIIEDEVVQAWELRDMVAELGGTVGGIALSYDQGLAALTSSSWDCAIVDINLKGEPVFPLVEMMEQAGIPFVYCSAYVDAFIEVYPEATSTVRVDKPVTIEKLRDAVLLALKTRKL
jgi:DNA-binding NtrC family response regulator